MNLKPSNDDRIAKITLASVYPLYLAKILRNGRTQQELDAVIEWLTGFNNEQIQEQLIKEATFESFFRDASLNPNAVKIKGVICGYRIEEIENPLMKQIRYLDKLVDDLAKGKNLEKIIGKR